ncbi:hypothetical protein [Streptacidiphilus sp. P02-A3a]|uniref:hypothetical protein n=1 Tax=Streptacidiphilus sp. P02-A3a TaxID=2704468 RepID=UPI0015F8D417|nr:hypothetical protein [Streptacidiphilus sp. P02-A3a]QMU70177.1 hypothetical protein GXP74_20035 [Streptacidiphilus sp. P02-A3a]
MDTGGSGESAELVERALAAARVAEETDDWDEYRRLLWRAAADGPGSLPLALELIGSPDPVDRATGCDLLGNTSDQNEAVRGRAAAALVGLARRESESCVLCSLAGAIERTYDQRAVPVLVELAAHPTPGSAVRWPAPSRGWPPACRTGRTSARSSP